MTGSLIAGVNGRASSRKKAPLVLLYSDTRRAADPLVFSTRMSMPSKKPVAWVAPVRTSLEVLPEAAVKLSAMTA